MTQVITFFGWLSIGIGVTLAIFGHISIVFVYDLSTLWETLFPEDGISSLIYSAVGLVPGLVLLSIGKFMKKLDDRAAAQESAHAQGEGEEA